MFDLNANKTNSETLTEEINNKVKIQFSYLK